MTVSVIVPNFNHEKYLRQRIDSILNQTFRDFELIILDDCSQDNSRDIINEYKSKYPEIKTFYNSSNSGSPCSQWNLGVSLAKGEFLWIAESDDYAEPGFLEETVSILKKNIDAGLVFCDSNIVNEERCVKYLASERPAIINCHDLNETLSCKREFSLKSFIENPVVNVSSVLFRKDAYLKAGQADPSMKYCGDWLLYVNIFLKSGIAYFPEPLNTFRLHHDSQYHKYYKTNTFILEKMKVYLFIIQNLLFSFSFYSLLLKEILKTMILRFICFLKLEFLLPALPRIPAITRNRA